MNSRLLELLDGIINKGRNGYLVPRHIVQKIMHYAAAIVCECGDDKFSCSYCGYRYDKCNECYKKHLSRPVPKWDCVECDYTICRRCMITKNIYGDYFTFCCGCSINHHPRCAICAEIYPPGTEVTDLCSVHNIFACGKCTNKYFQEFRLYGPLYKIRYRCRCNELIEAQKII